MPRCWLTAFAISMMSRFAFWTGAQAALAAVKTKCIAPHRGESSALGGLEIVGNRRRRERARHLAGIVSSGAVGQEVKIEIGANQRGVFIVLALLPNVGAAGCCQGEG